MGGDCGGRESLGFEVGEPPTPLFLQEELLQEGGRDCALPVEVRGLRVCHGVTAWVRSRGVHKEPDTPEIAAVQVAPDPFFRVVAQRAGFLALGALPRELPRMVHPNIHAALSHVQFDVGNEPGLSQSEQLLVKAVSRIADSPTRQVVIKKRAGVQAPVVPSEPSDAPVEVMLSTPEDA